VNRHISNSLIALAAVLPLTLAACSSSDDDNAGSAAPPGAAGSSTVADPGPGGLYLTASGESLAVTGYDFPPATPDDTFLVDG
jgi:hypothetical protein